MQQDELKNENIGRVLHGLFATAIVCQLFSSFAMKTPAFSRFIGLAQGDAFFLHKTIGLLAFAFVVCYWIWFSSGDAINYATYFLGVGKIL